MGMRYEAEVCTNETNMNGTLLTADVFRATLEVSWPSCKQNFTVLPKSAQLSYYFHCITEPRSPCKNTIHSRGETVPTLGQCSQV